ncbi:suppressor protein SRP40 isoform X1 [Glossina fuscipes]|uniref:Suppressor protein SRP40 isoform X1 n=2 Tax=Nemorhina TaxID=44051 RepID=A0A9C6DUR3_9MUSC|nr:suppressor protein SRP40 isoform X1 [Glossina fuscipes]XP_037889204.1 suppressor protein SRP40 isoform X1 [Glossina fuscipes]
MMETFLVLGLCFILYEALDFFQGCIHSATPSASDQIDAYRRQLDEQRQKQQEEQFLANLTPLLSAQLAAAGFTFSTSTNSTVSTASVISDLKLQIAQRVEGESHSVSTPALNGAGGTFRPVYNSIYETQLLQGSSSLPRDYYYLQQQQLKNKTSSKSILSRFSSNSDNRIYPENSALPSLSTGVITTQPTLQNCRPTLDTETPIITVPPTSSVLAVELKRAIISNNNNNSCSKDSKSSTHHKSNQSLNSQIHDSSTSSEEDEDADTSDSDSSTAGSASLNSGAFSSDHDLADERTFPLGSCSSSSHTDFREIECERMRRQCVSVKRIYSISEKF